jgi:hypothetical protein
MREFYPKGGVQTKANAFDRNAGILPAAGVKNHPKPSSFSWQMELSHWNLVKCVCPEVQTPSPPDAVEVNQPKSLSPRADVFLMGKLTGTELFLIVAGTAFMLYAVLKAIAQGAILVASEEIAQRRAAEARRRAEDAAAEAFGRAAALEPLEIYPDGSIVEPILAEVEERPA